jgi:hypothetical protein
MKHYDAYDVTLRHPMAERWRWQDEHVGAHRLLETTIIPLVAELAAPIVGRESARVQAPSPTTRAEDGAKPLKRVLEELAERHGFAGRDLAHDRVEPHVAGDIDRMQIKSPVNRAPAGRPAHAGRMVARARAALSTVRRAMTTRRRQLFGCLR